MAIDIRMFQVEDIPYKVKWINDPNNNRYLHYDLPLKEDQTFLWFQSLQGRQDRADYTITWDGDPVGLIGLLNIDNKNKKAEYYICLGEERYKGKGVASAATDILIRKSHGEFGLKKIYLFTEVENIRAQKLFERIGFEKEGLLRNDLIYYGKSIDRFVYGLHVESYIEQRSRCKDEL